MSKSTSIKEAPLTKSYVDTTAQGLHVLTPVKAATTANITLSNEQTIDGISVVAGVRVLVKDQSTGSQNGIYICVDGGSWTRATDFDDNENIRIGDFVFCEGGTTNGGHGFVMTGSSNFTSSGGSGNVGSHTITFTRFSGLTTPVALNQGGTGVAAANAAAAATAVGLGTGSDVQIKNLGIGTAAPTSSTGEILATNLSFGSDLFAGRKYIKSISGISSSGFTDICNVTGDNLASSVRMTLHGTALNVVVNVQADIIVNHFEDIYIKTESGHYTQLTLKIISNNNDSFTVQAKSNSSTAVTLYVEVFPFNSETVDFSVTPHSSKSVEHVCYAGMAISATGGNNGNVRVGGGVHVSGSLGVGTAESGTTGEIRAIHDITAFYSSDKRLKTNIQKIQDPLTKLQKIGGYTFDWIPKEGIHSHTGNDIGVIAQEIEEVLPEITTTRDNGYKAVRYEKLTAYLIECVKAQQTHIQQLEDRLVKLEKKD